ncbi:MAG: GntR family transcriptional regulator [Verrucomicrobiae bacterium]|nr:GntR family transcriptional regulator [Verrucomicrobiae bacterium]
MFENLTSFKIESATSEPAHRQIEQFLRRLIVSGKLASNSRLPTTAALARQWGVGVSVVQKAMAPLVAEGLLGRSRKRGTFVLHEAGRLSVAILVGARLTQEGAAFPRSICHHLMSRLLEGHPELAIRVYDGINEMAVKDDIATAPNYQNYLHDLENSSFLGVIKLFGERNPLPGEEASSHPPGICFGPPLEGQRSDAMLDFGAFGRDAVRFFAERGRRKLVYIRTIDSRHPMDDDVREARLEAERHEGVELDVIQLATSSDAPAAARHREVHDIVFSLGQAICSGARSVDGMMIPDDVAALACCMALQRAGLGVPKDLWLAVMANQNIPYFYGTPVLRYEYSPRRVADVLVDLLFQYVRLGRRPSEPMRISSEGWNAEDWRLMETAGSPALREGNGNDGKENAELRLLPLKKEEYHEKN